MLSGLDEALHGTDHLKGWGQLEWPNPVLLNVRGFNMATHEFEYAVNPLFGSQPSAERGNALPASITLDLRWDLGPSRETARIVGLFGNGDLNAAEIKHRLLRAASATGSDMDRILDNADSLALTAPQRSVVRVVASQLAATRDSIYGALATYLSTRAGDLDGSDVRGHWHSAGRAIAYAIYESGKHVHAILSPPQRDWLRQRALAPSLWYTPDWLERATAEPITIVR